MQAFPLLLLLLSCCLVKAPGLSNPPAIDTDLEILWADIKRRLEDELAQTSGKIVSNATALESSLHRINPMQVLLASNPEFLHLIELSIVLSDLSKFWTNLTLTISLALLFESKDKSLSFINSMTARRLTAEELLKLFRETDLYERRIENLCLEATSE